MLISLEVAVEGAAGLGEGGRGPKVEPRVPASPGLATVCSLAIRICSGLQHRAVSPSQENSEIYSILQLIVSILLPSFDGNEKLR